MLPKILLHCFILFCFETSCRRADTYPDYKNVVGKYKLVYINKGNFSWPVDSVIRINPSDKYEIEFKKMCKVMLSNSATDHVSSLYDGYRTEVVKATRAINSRPSGRGEVSELLVMNY